MLSITTAKSVAVGSTDVAVLQFAPDTPNAMVIPSIATTVALKDTSADTLFGRVMNACRRCEGSDVDTIRLVPGFTCTVSVHC